ncbi:MAG: glutamate--tRNA ligase [Candidatus Omnitrophota bacterium]
MIRVRFAPSPTGNLHIGGARTALFNWLYAKAKAGQFILRIEDTDQQRSKKEYLDEILESLSWLGFNWDELYFQSQRLDIYKEYAQRLLKDGKAYCAAKEEEPPKDVGSGRMQEAIILKVPSHTVKIDDLIHGEVEFDAGLIKDQVLIKSDGRAAYNFACVVDDALMGITHVIRGDDHISNTPKQVLLYKALGFDIPVFAHLPLILNKGGGRLSKRTGATAVSEYRGLGYLPEALVNYLLLLGWSPGENREIIDIQRGAKIFDIKDANKTAAVFDFDKLNWINNQYIKNSVMDRLLSLLTPMLKQRFPQGEDYFSDRQWLESVIGLYQGRINTLADLLDWGDFFFLNELEISQALKDKFLTRDLSKYFNMFIERLEGLNPFMVASIEEEFRNLVKELNINSRQLIHPVRVVLTGKTIGPGLFEVIYYLGRERAIKRLKRWIMPAADK